MKALRVKNKYYTLTCPLLCIGTLLRLVILGGCALVFLLFCFSNNQSDSFFVWCYVVLFVVLFRMFSYWKMSVFRAFIIVRFDEVGISNRYCSIKWDDIQKIGIDDLHEPNLTLLKEYNFGMLCYVQNGSLKKTESFLNYDKNAVIFFIFHSLLL